MSLNIISCAASTNLGPYFQAGAVAIVGIGAGWIALQQARTARTKVQLDLFEKRKPIFESTLGFAWRGANVRQLESKHIRELAGHMITARFLFDDDVHTFMSRLNAAGMIVRQLEGADRMLSREEEALLVEVRAWFKAREDEMYEVFRPYLTLEAKKNHIGERVAAVELPASVIARINSNPPPGTP